MSSSTASALTSYLIHQSALSLCKTYVPTIFQLYHNPIHHRKCNNMCNNSLILYRFSSHGSVIFHNGFLGHIVCILHSQKILQNHNFDRYLRPKIFKYFGHAVVIFNARTYLQINKFLCRVYHSQKIRDNSTTIQHISVVFDKLPVLVNFHYLKFN